MAALYGILGGSLLVYLGMAWLVTKLAGLSGMDAYLVWAILAVLGVLGAGAIAWWKMRKQNAAPAEGSGGEVESGSDEIDTIIKDADAKLAASRIAPGGSLSHLPLVYIIGDHGSTKTSVVLHSGLEPELLAGQVYQDNNVVAPTRTANLWVAQGTVLAEAGPKVLADPPRWLRMIRRMKPGSLKSVVGSNQQAPRAAVVCVDLERFAQAGAADYLSAMSRTLGEKLGQISQTLGISFPVYVLFTRSDRVPFFADYVRTLTNEEASQVLGATMPMRSRAGGVYAEEESQRLTWAFDQIFHSLADRRIHFLPRENDATKVPGAYEFPREFRKLRTPLVQFLVELCRPSQLRVSPFLRGFYFTGVRPVVVQDAVQPAAQAPARQAQRAGSATGVFQVPGFQQGGQAAAPQYVGTKRVPQWVFLTRLFNSVLLKDSAAFAASGSSTKTSTMQRVLLGLAALLCLGLAAIFTTSYFKNREMVNGAVTAAEAIPAAEAAGDNVASLDSLQRLETLRQSLEQLTRYRAEGRPFGMGFGLYAGDDLYPHVRTAYYNRFAQLLFRQGQGALVAHLNGVPVAPGPADDYGLTYDVLKGYLITTAASDKTSESSPAPILLKRWAEGRNVDAARMQLADKQFTFYARDLKNGNPFSSTADLQPVQRARAYLSQFSGIERVYQFMISQAGKTTVNFNRDIKDSAQAVVNGRDVPAAFTKQGYAFMQDALRRADQFFGGERWVLCDAVGNVPVTNCGTSGIDRGKLTQDLSARYVDDFIKQWRTYFRNTTILKYADLKDASRKLSAQAGPQSPILGLFWLASQNTGVDFTKIPGADKIQKAFQPVHAVVPPGQMDRYISPQNQPYHSALGMLQSGIDTASNMPTVDPATAMGVLSNATNAKGAVRQVAQTFNIDQDEHIEQTVQRLLEEPITSVETMLRSLGPRELNGKGAGLCSQISGVLNKYPFNPTSPADASLAEVNSVLKPGEGALWAFYETNLKAALLKQGNQYVPSGSIPLNPGFVAFFNSMSRFSDQLYRGGPDPKLTYTVRALKSDGIQDLVLTVDGQALPAANPQPRQVSWPSGAPLARFTGKVGTSDLPSAPYEGLWAAFRLFNDAEVFEPAGTGYNLEWVLQLRFGRGQTSTANAPRARYFVDLGGAPLIFRKGTTGMRCVAKVAQ
jgi:type VI secretion system protein ImpL